jgi:hypothetical protein
MSFEIDKVCMDFLGFRVIRCLISINKSIFRSFMVIGRVTRHYRSRYEFLLGVRLENFWVLTKSLGWVLISLVLGAVWSENVTSPSRKCFQTLICSISWSKWWHVIFKGACKLLWVYRLVICLFVISMMCLYLVHNKKSLKNVCQCKILFTILREIPGYTSLCKIYSLEERLEDLCEPVIAWGNG